MVYNKYAHFSRTTRTSDGITIKIHENSMTSGAVKIIKFSISRSTPPDSFWMENDERDKNKCYNNPLSLSIYIEKVIKRSWAERAWLKNFKITVWIKFWVVGITRPKFPICISRIFKNYSVDDKCQTLVYDNSLTHLWLKIIVLITPLEYIFSKIRLWKAI